MANDWRWRRCVFCARHVFGRAQAICVHCRSGAPKIEREWIRLRKNWGAK